MECYRYYDEKLWIIPGPSTDDTIKIFENTLKFSNFF